METRFEPHTRPPGANRVDRPCCGCWPASWSYSPTAATPYVAAFDTDRTAFLSGVFSGSLVRCSVPLFVMMTAVLLLPVRTDTAAFYRRRIGRVVLALVFWSVALPLLYFLYVRRPATPRRSRRRTTRGTQRCPGCGTSSSTSTTRPRRCGTSTCSSGST